MLALRGGLPRGRGGPGGPAPREVDAWLHIGEDGLVSVFTGGVVANAAAAPWPSVEAAARLGSALHRYRGHHRNGVTARTIPRSIAMTCIISLTDGNGSIDGMTVSLSWMVVDL